jgi:hypothetical protein
MTSKVMTSVDAAGWVKNLKKIYVSFFCMKMNIHAPDFELLSKIDSPYNVCIVYTLAVYQWTLTSIRSE